MERISYTKHFHFCKLTVPMCFFVFCNFVYIIAIYDSLVSTFIHFSKTQIMKEKKVFWKIFKRKNWIYIWGKIVKLKYILNISNFILYIVSIFFFFFLNRRCIHIFNCRNFQNFIHITVKLILNRKIIIQWNFKKVLKHNMHKANYLFSWSVFFLLKVLGFFILTLNDSKCFILALKMFVFVFKKEFF